MYDLDRVFVVNENYGDIVYVKEVENFVRKTGYSTTMCRPRDPRTKGRVEALVGYIRGSFLEGRTYTGIDSLNSACLMWLDSEGNGTINAATKKIPRDMFREESKYLIPVTQTVADTRKILNVTHKNSIKYKGNEYAMPKGECESGDSIRVEEKEGVLTLYNAESNQFICNHTLHEGEGNVITLEEVAPSNVSFENIRRTFGNDERLNAFLDKVHPKRYLFAQCRQIDHLVKYYTDLQVMSAIEYCLRADKYNTTELAAYLIYKFGVNKSRRCFSKEKVIMYSKRADKIKEELGGGD